MRNCAAIAVLVLGFLPATAASRRDWNDCKADDADRSIAGCTRILQGRGETADNRARAYNNRGAAYQTKGDLARAIADFNEAIRLDPKDVVAYKTTAASGFIFPCRILPERGERSCKVTPFALIFCCNAVRRFPAFP